MPSSKAYLIGGGIASLASAAFLIRDGQLPGRNIFILEESALLGGSLDGHGSAEDGYLIRGGRMFDDDAFTCTYELLSFIPALSDPARTLLAEVRAFNKQNKTCSTSRLVEKGKKVDLSSMGFDWRDRLDLLKLLASSETKLSASQIRDNFTPHFFKTNFWYLWCTTFAFQPWHSAVEFKRYLQRYIQQFPQIHNLAGIRRTPYNQYDAIVLPLTEWLKKQGVNFLMNSRVLDLEFTSSGGKKRVERIQYLAAGKKNEINLAQDDYVFATIGSMTADYSLGTMTVPPQLKSQKQDGAWQLWENLAKKDPTFGNPAAFAADLNGSLWESFTVTFRDPTFFQKEIAFTGNQPGTGGLVTFKDSNWLMSIVVPKQPHFLGQPENVQVCWGYGLFPDQTGNYVRKKMSACSGAEILTEVCSHLGFTAELPQILKSATCIPCLLPYITSQFMPRKKGDRPQVVPAGSLNLAFIGQYCEIPRDTVFTVEYSVRSAQQAVYQLLKLRKKVAPIYNGQLVPRVLFNSARMLLK